MYSVIIPANFSSPTYNRERVLEDLRKMKTNRLLLPGFEYVDTDPNCMEPYYQKAGEEIQWFHEHGITVGLWFWSFIISGENNFTPMVDITGVTSDRNFAGSKSVTHVCPLDENFIRLMQNHIRKCAMLHPDLILFDDDYSFGHHSSGKAQMCLCDLHRKRIEKDLGEALPPNDRMFPLMFGGSKNRYRSAYMKACKEALEEFAAKMREALDEVDPSIQMAQCACIASFDGDGSDPYTISKKLAGKTKPYLRLSGAPYWEDRDYPGGTKDQSKMIEMIEMSRLEASWRDDNNIEIVSEGDTYPRPRHHCPASFLNLFDAALRSDGHLDGIQHYCIDYSSGADYERGYIESSVRMRDDLDRLSDTFSNADTVGIRVYESMKKIEDADYTGEPVSPEFIRNQFFTRSVRYAAHNSLPTTYYGSGCAGLLFGESARHFDEEVLNKPILLDAIAAKLFMEKGIDTGLLKIEDEYFQPTSEWFTDGEVTAISADVKGVRPSARHLLLKDTAKVLSRFDRHDGPPASYTYQNEKGQRFLVFAVNAYLSPEDYYRSYTRQAQIFDFLEKSGAPVPVKTLKHPDLYVIASEEKDRLHVALFNCFPDEIFDMNLDLAKDYSGVTIYRASGALKNRQVTISHLAAYDWCYFTLTSESE